METFKSTEFIDGLVSFSVVCSLSLLKPGLVCATWCIQWVVVVPITLLYVTPLKHREIRTPRKKKTRDIYSNTIMHFRSKAVSTSMFVPVLISLNSDERLYSSLSLFFDSAFMGWSIILVVQQKKTNGIDDIYKFVLSVKKSALSIRGQRWRRRLVFIDTRQQREIYNNKRTRLIKTSKINSTTTTKHSLSFSAQSSTLKPFFFYLLLLTTK